MPSIEIYVYQALIIAMFFGFVSKNLHSLNDV